MLRVGPEYLKILQNNEETFVNNNLSTKKTKKGEVLQQPLSKKSMPKKEVASLRPSYRTRIWNNTPLNRSSVIVLQRQKKTTSYDVTATVGRTKPANTQNISQSISWMVTGGRSDVSPPKLDGSKTTVPALDPHGQQSKLTDVAPYEQ